MAEYHPLELFDINKDRITYKYSNSVNNICYNHNDSTIQLNKEVDTPYLYFNELNDIPYIKHGFSTRLGGVSNGVYTSMNLSFNRGDKVEDVKTNYERIFKGLTLSNTKLAFSDQVHDTRIHQVVENDSCLTGNYERQLIGIDGMITNVEGITLVTSYADCVPLYFVDPVHKAIGLSHSGWKGTVNKIGKETVLAMQKAYGTNPADLICAIGPSICADCYEISADVAKEFMKVFTKEVTDKILYQKSKDKYQLDLWLTNQEVLMEAGVLKEHIVNSNVCTCCNHTLLFSHRASKGQRGNLAAFLALVSRE